MLTESLTAAFVRIALAIVLDAVALIVWDIGTRSPSRLAADIRAAISQPGAVGCGLVRFVAGVVALLAALFAILPLAVRAADFTIVACWSLIAALLVEQLLGPDLRARLGRRHGERPEATGGPRHRA